MYEATIIFKTQKTFIMVLLQRESAGSATKQPWLVLHINLCWLGIWVVSAFLSQAPPNQPNCAVVQGIFNEILKIFHTMLSGKSRKRKKNRRKSAKPLRDNATATAHLHRLWALRMPRTREYRRTASNCRDHVYFLTWLKHEKHGLTEHFKAFQLKIYIIICIIVDETNISTKPSLEYIKFA